MLIARDQEIAGLPTVRARELMRANGPFRAVTVSVVGKLLEIPHGEAKRVVERLASEGLLRRVEATEAKGSFGVWHDEADIVSAHDQRELWVRTVAGNALSKARIGKPMPAI